MAGAASEKPAAREEEETGTAGDTKEKDARTSPARGGPARTIKAAAVAAHLPGKDIILSPLLLIKEGLK
jgi:hypothetical protein